jgi:hypothetical protein
MKIIKHYDRLLGQNIDVVALEEVVELLDKYKSLLLYRFPDMMIEVEEELLDAEGVPVERLD